MIDDKPEQRIENAPWFLKRIAKARASIAAGKGIPWDEIEAEDDKRTKPARARRKKRG